MTIPLTEPATDWTGQTLEDRLHLCAATLHIHGLLTATDYFRTKHRIEARADLQRERITTPVGDNRRWSWWAVAIDDPELTPETYILNKPTREAIIANATRYYDPGTWIAIVEGTQDGPFRSSPFAEDGDCKLMEELECKFLDDNGSRWGEDFDGLSFPREDLAKALNRTFAHVIAANEDAIAESAWTFTETRNAEVLQLGGGE